MRRRATDQAASRAAESCGEPIDLAHLDRATFGDRALRRDVLTLFERQSAQLAAEIAGAPNAAARAAAAHKLRGAALGIGAKAVAEAAAAIERSSGDAIELAGAVTRLSARVAETRATVARLLAAI